MKQIRKRTRESKAKKGRYAKIERSQTKNSSIIQIPTRHHIQGPDLPSKETPIPIPNPVQMIAQNIPIPDPALYLCCFLVWSCLGKAMSSAKQKQRKWWIVRDDKVIKTKRWIIPTPGGMPPYRYKL